MKQRCYYTKCRSYKDYGGRGIVVCDRWVHSFENFLLDMGERPIGFSIERMDSNKNYCPENCIWIARSEESKNRTSNHWITYENETKTLTDWAKYHSISRRMLTKYLKKMAFKDAVQKLKSNNAIMILL